MIINRYRTTIKRGRMQDAIAFVKEFAPDLKRVCVTFAGDNDILQADFEFEDIDAYAAFTKTSVLANPGANAEWAELTTANSNELLLVIE